MDTAYERAMTILTENRDKLDILTEALLEFETAGRTQLVDILEYGVMKNPPEKVTPPPMPSDVEEEGKKDQVRRGGPKRIPKKTGKIRLRKTGRGKTRLRARNRTPSPIIRWRITAVTAKIKIN